MWLRPRKILVFLPKTVGTVLGAIAVPSTALTVPLFLMFSKMGFVDTPLAVIIPCLITPFGFYLMWYFPRRPFLPNS